SKVPVPSGNFQHSFYGEQSPLDQVLAKFDLWVIPIEAIVQFFQSVELHECTFTATTTIILMDGHGDQPCMGHFFLHLMEYARFGAHQKGGPRMFFGMGDHPGGGSHKMGNP